MYHYLVVGHDLEFDTGFQKVFWNKEKAEAFFSWVYVTHGEVALLQGNFQYNPTNGYVRQFGRTFTLDVNEFVFFPEEE